MMFKNELIRKERFLLWKRSGSYVWCISLWLSIMISSCGVRDKEPVYADEREAIKAVIANETESYYRQDLDGWKSNFIQSDEFRMYAYWEGWPEKVKFYNGFEQLLAEKRKQFEQDKTIWKNSVETRENENIRVSADMAWYTFEQFSVEKESGQFLGKSLETRILEKEGGQWKIAYIGYHYFPLADSVKKVKSTSTLAGGRSSTRRSG